MVETPGGRLGAGVVGDVVFVVVVRGVGVDVDGDERVRGFIPAGWFWVGRRVWGGSDGIASV